MENKRYLDFDYKQNNAKLYEVNHLIANYIKSEVDNSQKLDNLLDNISKRKYRYKHLINQNNNNNCGNINSSNYTCKKPKSVDDINYKYNNSKNIKNNNHKILCYKRPRHYINNKSVDIIDKKINYANNDYNHHINTYNNNCENNYCKYNSDVFTQKKIKNNINKIIEEKYLINSKDEFIKRDSSNVGINNSTENIFTKIPTNISRIKTNNNDSIDYSLDYSLLNNNINNYYSINTENKKYINNYSYYNNTFYNEKNDNELINKRIHFKTPIKINKLRNNNRYMRKKSEDYYTNNSYKNNMTKEILNKERIRTENYCSNDTSSTNIGTKRLSYKYNKILTPQIKEYKDYLIVFKRQNNINYQSFNNVNAINNMNISNDNNLRISNNIENIFKHKKLSSYILKNKKEKKSKKYHKRKNSAESYDNSIFKKKIKLVKRKKRPNGRRNKTFDENENILDKPSATPIKKENDKGGKIDLKDKQFNTLNNSFLRNKVSKKNNTDRENFNHHININIKKIKANLNKIILIQKWWKNILQNKIIKINKRFKEYKLNKEKTKNKINMISKKTTSNSNTNEYKTQQTNNSIIKSKEFIIKRKNIPKIYYMSKIYYKNIYPKIFLIQKFIRNKILNNKKVKDNFKSYKNDKLKRYCVNNIYFGNNEYKYILDNFVYHIQKSDKIKNDKNKKNENKILFLPLIENCFISKINFLKQKKTAKNNELKIINEINGEYVYNSKNKKHIYEIDNVINNEIFPIPNNKKKESILIKIEKQTEIKINDENIINTPKLKICNISKLIYHKEKNQNNNIIIKLPINGNHIYISKKSIYKSKNQFESLIYLQKNIINYLKNKANKEDNILIDSDYMNKPSLPNIFISKLNKTNLNNDIKKIKYIQKKFREYQENNININTSNLLINDLIGNKEDNTRNSLMNDYHKNTINDLKSHSSYENTTYRSKKEKNNYNKNEEKENIIKEIDKQKLKDFIQILVQKITKNINQYTFYKLKKIRNITEENIFFSTIKRIINIYDSISNSKDDEFKEFNELIKNNLLIIIQNFGNYNFISYIPEKEENNLKNMQLFLYNDKLLSKFIIYCLKIEKKHLNKNINNLIEYRLIKEPLKNQNIFTIIKYMDLLYENIINKSICLYCFCKDRENCRIGCSCHHSTNLNNITTKFSKYLPNKRRNKTHTTSLSYSFDNINYYICDSKNNINEDIEIINNFFLYDRIFKRNVYYNINKVNKLNNSMDESESSEIDVFQKMNEGSQSLIKREMINKIFDEYTKEKANKKNNNIYNPFNKNNFEGKKIRHISKLNSSSSDIINIPNCEEEDIMLNKIKKYFEEKK